MRRVFQRKAKLVSCRMSDGNAAAHGEKRTQSESSGSSRTSATMIGLALSVAASGLVIHQHDDKASAAEPQASISSAVSEPPSNSVSGHPFDSSVASTPAVPKAASSNGGNASLKHVVREGDTLWNLSLRYHLSAEKIASANGLESGSVLRVGQTLEIPVTERFTQQRVVSAPAEPLPSTSRNLASLQVQNAAHVVEADVSRSDVTDGDTSARAVLSRTLAPESVQRDQTISRLRQSRDQLRASLADLHDEAVPQSDEPELSGQASRTDASLQVGDEGRLIAQTVPAESSNAVGESSADAVQTDSSLQLHKVEPGETLGAIALLHDVSSDDLVAANRINDPDRLQIDQTLVIPDSEPDSESGRLPASSNSLDLPPELTAKVEDFRAVPVESEAGSPEAPVDERPTSHQIKPGETLATIARDYGVSLRDLIESNRIRNPNRIFAGRVLQVPRSPISEDAPVEVRSASASEQQTLVSSAPSAESRLSVTDIPALLSAPVRPLPASTRMPEDQAADSEPADPLNDPPTLSDGQGLARPAPSADDVVNEPSSTTVSDEDSPSSEANVYVENLIGEIDAIATQVRQDAQRDTVADTSQDSQAAVAAVAETERAINSSTEIAASGAAVVPDTNFVRQPDADAVNLEFVSPDSAAERDSQAVADDSASETTEADISVSESDSEQLVAVAPLGSERYAPLSQPVTGRVVSPDLPPLPGSENYLPNGSSTFNGYLWPARGVLTSGYGWRWGRMHRGIDIAAPVGTPIYAAAPGVIEFAGWNSGGYGNMVDIRHADGSKTRYAHNSRNLVRVGQTVSQGQQIAEMGSTGYSTGPHVHFEVHLPQGGAVNPIAYLPSR